MSRVPPLDAMRARAEARLRPDRRPAPSIVADRTTSSSPHHGQVSRLGVRYAARTSADRDDAARLDRYRGRHDRWLVSIRYRWTNVARRAETGARRAWPHPQARQRAVRDLLRNPPLADAADKLVLALRENGKLDKRLYELIVLVVVRHWSAQYAWAAHEAVAAAAGMSPDTIEAIRAPAQAAT